MSTAPGHAGAAVWVLHRGALGDGVLLWPLLRAHTASGERVALVTDGSKAQLAEREVGVVGLDAEQERFNALWREGARPEPVQGVRVVMSFMGGGGAGTRGEVWLRNARAMFPGAQIETAGRPDARLARFWSEPERGGAAAARITPAGPVVLHVGAGSEEKRWPLERFGELAALLRGEGREALVLAGEVEAERFTAAERAAFGAMGGRYLDDLGALADALRGAGAVVGCDSGPAHLAAQMGKPTLAVFGPTDPERWGPVGPCVGVVRPETPRGMEWAGVHAVRARLAALSRAKGA